MARQRSLESSGIAWITKRVGQALDPGDQSVPDEMDHRPKAGSGAPNERLATELRAALRQAQRVSGASIKVNALAKKLHLSASSVYAYLDGTTLPSRGVLDRLLQELGITGPELGRLASLRDEAEDSRRVKRKRSTGKPAAAPQVTSPCQLPPDVRGFTGRTEQLAELDELLAIDETSTAPTVAVVCGTAGVGKTALVAHWAHRVRDEFPDGLLYVDLRGFDPEQPREPAEVLGGFLRWLGVTGDSISHDVAELAAQFRSELDRKWVLLFLDNASNEAQVRPLLPNSARCVVVVTSRHQLPGLVARDGAHRIDVPSLPIDDAIALMRILIGDPRVQADEQGAADLVERCARLPLTIRIGADLAATRKRSPLKELADELHRYHLDLFNVGGDERTAVRAVFSWSYLHLRADRARAFRLLGLHPGQEIDTSAAAALLGVAPAEAQLRIDDLVRASLLEEAGDRRYRMHDLLRAYAREQVTDEDEKKQALRALFDYYLGTAAAAMELIAPYERANWAGLPAPSAGAALDGLDHAVSWLDTERRNLLAIAEFGASQDWPNVTIFTSTVLSRYLDARAHYGDAATLHSLTLNIARNAGAIALEGQELQRIGIVHMRLGNHPLAKDHLERALAVGRQVSDRYLESRSLYYLGLVSLRLGHNENALAYLDDALPLVREIANSDLEGHLISGLGFAHSQLGRYPTALHWHREALRIARRLSDKDLWGHVLNSLGLVYQRVGDTDNAYRCHRQVWGVAHRMGNRGLEADSLKSLGAVKLTQNRPGEAIRLLERSLTIAKTIGQRDIEGYARKTLGRAQTLIGDLKPAQDHLQSAITIARDTGNRELEAETLNAYGELLLPTNPHRATENHEQALLIARATQNRWQQAQSLDGLAATHEALGSPAAADLRTQAQTIRNPPTPHQ